MDINLPREMNSYWSALFRQLELSGEQILGLATFMEERWFTAVSADDFAAVAAWVQHLKTCGIDVIHIARECRLPLQADRMVNEALEEDADDEIPPTD
jgi:hypothetical protein